ncbi:hypothetical protein [Lysobacter enzymogenes]|uniref:hypothetical protein n=1 Tax=Lysobacter enzymogenes TaxID=69 RepID=UPI000899F586|nr:hypothetical protein [Lysobacter enzymogenes]SDW60495.1 hypothetical protein SAMN05421681_102326 [Lysobacter enzymogenes]
MRDSDVPVKTNEGRDEIEHRTRKLPPMLRSILLIVDGERSARHLRELAVSLHGPADALEQLEGMGLIASSAAVAASLAAQAPVRAAAASASADAAASPPAQRYQALYSLMSEAVRDHLGLRGYFLQLKIERCSNSDELAAVLPELSAALAKARKDEVAAQIEAQFAAGA